MNAPVRESTSAVAPREYSQAAPPVPARSPQLRIADAARALVPHAAWAVRRAGRAGTAGLALCGAAAVLTVAGLLPARSQLEALRADLARAQARPPAATERATRAATLPPRDSLPQLVDQVAAQARAAGLSLDSGTYEPVLVRGAHVLRYRITLPVEGTYPAIRGFVLATLAQAPNVALDGLKLERADVGTDVVSAELRFVAFVTAD